jgi:fluoride exporter
MWTQILAISGGASVGAVARWQLGLWLNSGQAHHLPWGTLTANALGAYLIGFGVTLIQSHPALDAHWRLVLITGFLGALTTFSTFSLETVSLFLLGKPGMAAANAALNLVVSLALTWLGLLCGEWWIESRGWA